MSTEPYSLSQQADETLDQIERLVQQTATLAREDVAHEAFFTSLLSSALKAVAGEAAAAWLRPREGEPVRLQHHLGLSAPGMDRAAERQHAVLMQQVVERNEPLLIEPGGGLDPASTGGPLHAEAGWHDSEFANPTPCLLACSPIVAEGEPAGLLEVFLEAGASPQAEHGYLRLVSVFADLAGDYLRNCQLRTLRVAQARRAEEIEFARHVHASLDLRKTAYVVANQARHFLKCDRVSVLLRERGRNRLFAVSGSDAIERRSSHLRKLERLAASVLATGESCWHGEGSEEHYPDLEAALASYQDESHARSLAVLPLTASQPEAEGSGGENAPAPLGALIIEQFERDRLEPEQQQRAAYAAEHAGLALHNARAHADRPLATLSSWLAAIRAQFYLDRLPRTAALSFAAVAVVAALCTVPADFEIEARGALQPELRRDIFAPTNGEIEQLHVHHGQQVERGDVLAVLRDPELEIEFQRVDGEIKTARQRLAALEASRVGNRRATSEQQHEYQRLTAEAEELKELLAGLERQHELLRTQREKLTLRSPLAGRVVTWNLETRLENRPVQRGHALMRIADESGPWVLELNVPDFHVGHVLDAQGQQEGPLPVTFVLATDPSRRYEGHVEQVAMITEAKQSELPMVDVVVALEHEALPRLRPGATAIARIACGRRSLGYVWLHDSVDAVRTWLML